MHVPKSASIPLNEIFAIHEHNSLPNTFSIFQFALASRRKLVHDFTCTNADECSQWIVLLRSIVFCTPIADKDVKDFNKKRKLLVVINPFSGTKAARRDFNLQVKPILDGAHLTYNVIETTHAGHATEIAKTFKLSETTEIATLGGDGILNEVRISKYTCFTQF